MATGGGCGCACAPTADGGGCSATGSAGATARWVWAALTRWVYGKLANKPFRRDSFCARGETPSRRAARKEPQRGGAQLRRVCGSLPGCK